MNVLPECIYVHCFACLLNPLELELNVVVSNNIGAGNYAWVLCKNSQYMLNHLSSLNVVSWF